MAELNKLAYDRTKGRSCVQTLLNSLVTKSRCLFTACPSILNILVALWVF